MLRAIISQQVSRPNLLMAEPEPPESISARKLVLETAKFNVLTAYSGREAMQLLEAFPNLSALIVHSGLQDVACEELIRTAKKRRSEMPVVLLATHHGIGDNGADYRITSHSPEELLGLLRRLFGDPRQVA